VVAVARAPLPTAWLGRDLEATTDWIVELDGARVAELERAVDSSAGVALGELRRDDAPLPLLGRDVAAWRDDLAHGRGFLLVRGVPVERLGDDGAARAFWILGLHLGRPIAQNPAGDLLGHVHDTGARRDDPMVRKYQTPDDIAFHVDLGDVVGLLCLRSGRAGGASRIASSVAVYNELAERRPDLVASLYEPYPLDRRNEERPGEDPFALVPICRWRGERLSFFFHSDYFRSAARLPSAPPLTPRQRDALDLFEAIATRPGVFLDMDFRPGDVQLLDNHRVVHARTAYADGAEPSQRRHLLRLWLLLGEGPAGA
jgi:alpha-ketoglutarate-dependent taurine dioxygenase